MLVLVVTFLAINLHFVWTTGLRSVQVRHLATAAAAAAAADDDDDVCKCTVYTVIILPIYRRRTLRQVGVPNTRTPHEL